MQGRIDYVLGLRDEASAKLDASMRGINARMRSGGGRQSVGLPFGLSEGGLMIGDKVLKIGVAAHTAAAAMDLFRAGVELSRGNMAEFRSALERLPLGLGDFSRSLRQLRDSITGDAKKAAAYEEQHRQIDEMVTLREKAGDLAKDLGRKSADAAARSPAGKALLEENRRYADTQAQLSALELKGGRTKEWTAAADANAELHRLRVRQIADERDKVVESYQDKIDAARADGIANSADRQRRQLQVRQEAELRGLRESGDERLIDKAKELHRIQAENLERSLKSDRDRYRPPELNPITSRFLHEVDGRKEPTGWTPAAVVSQAATLNAIAQGIGKLVSNRTTLNVVA